MRAKDINDEMKVAAAYAIANLIPEEELSPEYIIPNPFDKRVVKAVADAVAEAARKTGVARMVLFCVKIKTIIKNRNWKGERLWPNMRKRENRKTQ